ncbi:hypothetical protein [Tenacibaculum sp. M341]|uniref:hypothetical protein n=1 Tax=Tenacibaculum sp. M341 TaxID=2530339 RepID=UPI0014051752|nr:hypothetical protein [Tenacibaculum sp. M341]
MLRKILKTKDVKELTKNQQETINGGIICNYPCSAPEPSAPCICFEYPDGMGW